MNYNYLYLFWFFRFFDVYPFEIILFLRKRFEMDTMVTRKYFFLLLSVTWKSKKKESNVANGSVLKIL